MGEREVRADRILYYIFMCCIVIHLPSGEGGGDGCAGGRVGSTGKSPKLVQAQLCILVYIVANPCHKPVVGH